MRTTRRLVAAVLSLAAASPASATFPGENGALVFSGVDLASGTVQVWSVEPAQSDTAGPPRARCGINAPPWSADGQLIYFDSEVGFTNPPAIFRMNATGGFAHARG